MTDDKQKIDELVNMIDQFVNSGGGHMNVKNNTETGKIEVVEVKVQNDNDCGPNMACKVPTLFEGLDHSN